jgi:hypothetical protein
MKSLPAVLATFALTAGLAMSAPSQAATVSQLATASPGASCQLSQPTIATSVRGRATGFRNEGTINAFVICQFNSPTGAMTNGQMIVISTDGVARDVTCTGVNGFNLGIPEYSHIAYSSKTFGTQSTEGIAAAFIWTAADFGGTDGDQLPNQGYFTVTCILPPKTAIVATGFAFDQEIGS